MGVKHGSQPVGCLHSKHKQPQLKSLWGQSDPQSLGANSRRQAREHTKIAQAGQNTQAAYTYTKGTHTMLPALVACPSTSLFPALEACVNSAIGQWPRLQMTVIAGTHGPIMSLRCPLDALLSPKRATGVPSSTGSTMYEPSVP
jgi:hypothetical protein